MLLHLGFFPSQIKLFTDTFIFTVNIKFLLGILKFKILQNLKEISIVANAKWQIANILETVNCIVNLSLGLGGTSGIYKG